jgi:hypothetical protein
VIDNDALYFKVDALSRMDYVAAGMGPFMPLAGKKTGGAYQSRSTCSSREKLAQWGGRRSPPRPPPSRPSRARRSARKRRHAGSAQEVRPVAQRWLAAGVRTADLERIGSVAVFKKVAQAGEPSANLLYALEGALLGCARTGWAGRSAEPAERAGSAAAGHRPRGVALRTR